MPKRLQRVLGYQPGLSVAGPGMVDLRDPLDMLDRVSFGYDINAPEMPALAPPNPPPYRVESARG